jgi:DNA polymerase (family 10)
MQDRFQIAAALREIGSLLKVKGDNPFKAQAYERGARALENLQGDLDGLVKNRRLTEIAGIGNALAAVIEEINRTGECWMLQKLREELPPGAVELSAVPGLSLKKIIALHDALRIESVADLRTACQEGLVRTVKGFGQKSEAKLLKDIEKLEAPEERTLLHRALDEAERVLEYLRGTPDLIQADIAGALRRRKETVRHLRIVTASDQPKAVLDQFLRYPALTHTNELDQTHSTGRLASGLEAEIIVVPPADYVAALHSATGSRRHIAKLEELARSKAIVIGPNLPSGKRNEQHRVKSEEDIYRRFGLQYIPPEMREDEGEIEAAQAGTLPTPVTIEDIQGMTHCHTFYSDGQNTIEEMAVAAEAMGMKYLTITDHSPSAYYARGVQIDRLRAQWDEIARVQERVRIKLLRGTESDITEAGLLDYPDHILERFDIIIASIHARNKMDSDQMTRRLLRVLKLPLFKVWGHPLGRIIQSRPPFECRMDEVLDAVAESKAAIEVNGDPHRLDLEPRWIRAARNRGIKFLVSTDAHSIRGLGYLHYGVSMARRGWLSRDEVLNTRDTKDFIEAVHP